MRLYVCVFCTIYFAEAIDSYLLDLVYYFTSAIIAFSRISLSVFVCADGSHSLHDLVADIVFRSYEFKSLRLSFLFLFDKIKNLKILFHKKLFRVWFNMLILSCSLRAFVQI